MSEAVALQEYLILILSEPKKILIHIEVYFPVEDKFYLVFEQEIQLK